MKRLFYLILVIIISCSLFSCDDTEKEYNVVHYDEKEDTSARVTTEITTQCVTHEIVSTSVTTHVLPALTVETTEVTVIPEETTEITAIDTSYIFEEAFVIEAQTLKKAIEDEQTIVYVTPKGKKYHYSKTCPGKNAKEVSLEEAISGGKDACKKCVK